MPRSCRRSRHSRQSRPGGAQAPPLPRQPSRCPTLSRRNGRTGGFPAPGGVCWSPSSLARSSTYHVPAGCMPLYFLKAKNKCRPSSPGGRAGGPGQPSGLRYAGGGPPGRLGEPAKSSSALRLLTVARGDMCGVTHRTHMREAEQVAVECVLSERESKDSDRRPAVSRTPCRENAHIVNKWARGRTTGLGGVRHDGRCSEFFSLWRTCVSASARQFRATCRARELVVNFFSRVVRGSFCCTLGAMRAKIL